MAPKTVAALSNQKGGHSYARNRIGSHIGLWLCHVMISICLPKCDELAVPVRKSPFRLRVFLACPFRVCVAHMRRVALPQAECYRA